MKLKFEQLEYQIHVLLGRIHKIFEEGIDTKIDYMVLIKVFEYFKSKSEEVICG